MHDPSFMALALIVSEKMTSNKKVYAADADDEDDNDDDNDDAGKAVHMSRFCFAGEKKTEKKIFFSAGGGGGVEKGWGGGWAELVIFFKRIQL